LKEEATKVWGYKIEAAVQLLDAQPSSKSFLWRIYPLRHGLLLRNLRYNQRNARGKIHDRQKSEGRRISLHAILV
jgi:hypothetical protein